MDFSDFNLRGFPLINLCFDLSKKLIQTMIAQNSFDVGQRILCDGNQQFVLRSEVARLYELNRSLDVNVTT